MADDHPRRRNLISYLEELPRRGEREAYLWREGVRWRRVSYAALHQRALDCAAELVRSGLEPGQAVLLEGPETGPLVEALLGVLRAGGVAVPLDPGSAPEFRQKVAAKVEARLLVAPRQVEPPEGVRRIDLGSWPAERQRELPPVDPGPDERAEIIFTSGTTGDPKGVVLTHGNLTADFEPFERAFRKYEWLARPFAPLRVLSVLPLSHMFGQAASVFLGLAMGLTIVFVPARPRDIVDAARRRRAWGLITVPRVLDLVAAEIRRRRRGGESLEQFEARSRRLERWPLPLQAAASWRVQRELGWRFRLIMVGGAALAPELKRFWESMGYLVLQGYGLTETAPIVTITNPFDRRAEDVGRPIGEQELRIGPEGEVLVRGPNVMPGYLEGRREEHFEGEWFRTGDVGEIDPEGRLRIRGRLKDMIATPGGRKVYATDVEEALAVQPGVEEASVIGLPSPEGERIHAVLRLAAGADPDKAVQGANARLEPFQRIEGHTVWHDNFPRTPTGKVRKGALRDAVAGHAQGREAAVAPGAGTDVRSLLAQVAGKAPDRISDDLPIAEGLGLDSLDLVELASALAEHYAVEMPEQELARLRVGELERAIAAPAGVAPAREQAPEAARPAAAGAPPPQAGEPPAERPRRKTLRMPRWARRWPARLARRVVETAVMRPLVRAFARLDVRGLEHVRDLRAPYLVVANHRSNLDTVLLKTVLPESAASRLAPAMTTRVHPVYFGEKAGSVLRRTREWMEVRLAQLLVHAWPISDTGDFLASLSYAGDLADAGYSLLIFPEGRFVPEGEIARFREGIGVFARELRMPVVPVYLEGTAVVLPEKAGWPRPEQLRVEFGPALEIEPDADPAAATRKIEAAVRALAPPEVRGPEVESQAEKPPQEPEQEPELVGRR